MIRTWHVVVLQPGEPLREATLRTRRGVGNFLAMIHDIFPDANYVYAEAV